MSNADSATPAAGSMMATEYLLLRVTDAKNYTQDRRRKRKRENECLPLAGRCVRVLCETDLYVTRVEK